MNSETQEILDIHAPETFTDQKIFDFVVMNLANQGQKSAVAAQSENGTTDCLYRSDGGKKCAAGWMIPDELYLPAMESWAIAVVIRNNPQLSYLEPFRYLLEGLQRAHDNSGTVEYLKMYLTKVANERDVKPDIVDSITKWEPLGNTMKMLLVS